MIEKDTSHHVRWSSVDIAGLRKHQFNFFHEKHDAAFPAIDWIKLEVLNNKVKINKENISK